MSMILSDKTIRAYLDKGDLSITPLEDDQINASEPRMGIQIQPASVDLRLGKHFLKLDENDLACLDLEHPASYVPLEREEIVLPPHSFILATTMEVVRIA